MIFLSAQPDELYFLWQIKLQLFNFSSLGIKKHNVHVLICYNPCFGLNKEFEDFIRISEDAEFYIYADTRKSSKYLPSLRPHIIAKHYLEHPALERQCVFYHDSDILFRQLPNLEFLRKSNTWYAADTSSYLNTEYIVGTAGAEVFELMCQAVGICPDQVKANDINAGGAQYVIKNCTYRFWEKLEIDCEKLFTLLEQANEQNFSSRHLIIQSWCTDMWALWWNCLLLGNSFEISTELDFVCVYDHIDQWQNVNILHYTGSHKSDPGLFIKGKYTLFEPFFEDFSEVDKKTCSYIMVDFIDKYMRSLSHLRSNLKDVSFLILLRIDSEDRLKNLNYILTYISHWFDSNIYLLEADQHKKVNEKLLPENVYYEYVKDDNPRLYRALYINKLIQKSKTPIISIYDVDVILPVEQILKSVIEIRENNYQVVSPYDGTFLNVDKVSKMIFSKIMDSTFLIQNRGKYLPSGKRSFGGSIFLNKQTYIEAGMENLNITGWGPDDIERVKRLEILGYKILRISGSLYHLAHVRGENSGYRNENEMLDLMDQYLRICFMTKRELINEIKQW
jgi:hypothetical protein